ncbi:GAF domain-containing protein [Leptolyngbya cf. ectocarpi LEGE 11479]|uniref:GAF domain-containing protein n=1 Tax=Leptolyngbya cf. ectocarpi LEGE 11479 TaxID=1828722 RepID=A0A928ZQ25_LEPEC|nr:GAF domain-containing protein [Leptolyngbya ectocarpi]MBE9065815.1 GAF domain-containing protein [Leptolyngbya cf. ectocarpi LEGE 11479]
MSNTANTHPDKHSEELESLLDLDLSSETVDPDSTEHTLSDEDLTLYNQIPEEAISESLTETVTALPLTVESSMPFSTQGKRPFAIANSMAQATNLENLYQITVTELRKQFAADRALIYQFQSTTHGTVIAESLTAGYRPVLGDAIAALAFGAANTESYRQQAIINVTDTAAAATTPYQMQLYQHLQVQANLSLPIFLEDRLWGLLVIQTCTAPHQWSDREIALIYQVGTELTLKLQAHALQQQGQQEVIRERLLTGLVNTIRNSADIQQVFEVTTRTIRHYLKTDRVAVFQFHPGTNHGSGKIIAENVNADVISAKDVPIQDHCFGGAMAEAYRQGRFWAAADIYEQGLLPCHIDILSQFQVRANLVVPLLQKDQLWGLFCIHNCVGPRQWTHTEIAFVQRVAAQLNVALQQADYIDQVNEKNQQLEQIATQEQLITKITERLRQTTDLSKTLQITVRDIRHLLKADRVGLFQFDMATNYGMGEFVVEDVAAGVFSAKAAKVQDHCFAEDQAENYRKGRFWVVNDVTTLDLPDCLVELLSQLQVRASLVVPLLKGDLLWGLFCIHECTGPRQWQDSEVEFVHRIGAQLNLALKQADYLDQLQEKNAALTTTATREKASKEQLQQQVMQLLTNVRPALEGDLTVRAPVTDTEVGTVASAYNNTLQSLQKIVLEVQQAATQVGETSQLSQASVSSLNMEAQQQANSLEKALIQVQEMMNFTETVVNDAQRVEVAVQQANQTVQSGDTAMNRTVDGIMAIRSTVADTNQRIKQLSESSQKVSKILSLIGHFTTQTQLLALNASIEATRAGKYGRGFAVVADEVRSLARQSADATTEIEQLVQEIQVNTAEVSTAMDNGIQQVATGTSLVRDARQNLTAIVEATAQISGLIQGITQTTHKQAAEFKDVAVSVTEATEIANQTSQKSERLTQSIHQLLSTAETLQASTGKFKVG